jgi:ubiquinone/menaquinone biosynthesis C-methylase UbiE
MDINPLLSLIGYKMAQGEELELTELASEPLSNGLLSETRTLQGMGEVLGSRLKYVIGDASNPPFKANAFDGIVTPWLIDILPEPFESFSRRMNRIVKDSGEWISFGPLSFERHRPSDQFTSDEVLEQLKHAGFEPLASGWEEVPYLQSPIRAQHRREKIFWFRAKKMKGCKHPARFHYYPDWFENPDTKPPLARTNIENLFAQKNLEANILQSFVQGLSIKEMVNTLTSQAGMSEDEAESLVFGTVNRLLESGEIVSF